MTISTAIISGLIGVSGVIIGVVLGYLLNDRSRRSEKREERIEQTKFNSYRLLLELESYHFFIASFDMREELSPVLSRKGFENIRAKIYDELRIYDGLEESGEIVRVMSSYCYASEMDRRRDIRHLIELLGRQVNPRLLRMIGEVDKENEIEGDKHPDEFLNRVRKLQV